MGALFSARFRQLLTIVNYHDSQQPQLLTIEKIKKIKCSKNAIVNN